MNDFERGFAEGFQRGFEAGRKAAPAPHTPPPIGLPNTWPYLPVTGTGSPIGTHILDTPAGAVFCGMSENGVG